MTTQKSRKEFVLSNEHRCNRIVDAMNFYRLHPFVNDPNGSHQSIGADILTDLLHLSDQMVGTPHAFDFDALIHLARANYMAETTGREHAIYAEGNTGTDKADIWEAFALARNGQPLPNKSWCIEALNIHAEHSVTKRALDRLVESVNACVHDHESADGTIDAADIVRDLKDNLP